MRITFFSADPGNHRFIQPIIDRLALAGHECQLMTNWTRTDADLYWFDFCDNNLIVASKEDADHLKSKRVVARLHAVEAYMGYYKAIDWSCVDHLIFVSDHLKRKCEDADYKDCQVHVIPNGIDLEKFPFTPKHPDAKYRHPWHFGYVGNIVPQKGLLTFLHYFGTIRHEYPDAKFFLAGLSRMHGREGEYWEHAKAKIGNVFEEGETPDVNAWLEEKDITWLVQPSYAESFSLIVGEAMAKGIKPLINDFLGAEEVWPKECVYGNFAEFGAILEGPYQSAEYRRWVEDRYSMDTVMKQVEDLLR